ncbi:MAG: hypothetical protein FD166_1837 [Bacteroidetes bacterium]|nr:MAG: hypothetical protein FD166_1837 [Bacteroidota bacterium]
MGAIFPVPAAFKGQFVCWLLKLDQIRGLNSQSFYPVFFLRNFLKNRIFQIKP